MRSQATGIFLSLGLALLSSSMPASALITRCADLPGWQQDDQAAALRAFRLSCPQLQDPAWQAACAAAGVATNARQFFEDHFQPRLVGPGGRTLFTGYYEPEIAASPIQTPAFAYPIYAKPPELHPGEVWFDRKTIEDSGVLKGRGLEIAWLSDPVDVFFLQIQGSGRLRMPDGRVQRVGFAAKNGQPYRSIGQELIRRGAFRPAEVSAWTIKRWVRSHPEAGRELMDTNPSYVFFRKLGLPTSSGPIGAMNVPVTAGRSLAVDPAVVPLGAPVWVDAAGRDPIRSLMVAQDTGSAIKGPGRADVFIGSGARAGVIAGRMRDEGRMYVLIPKNAQAKASR
ncbi:MAG: MltA domain-containing protein [Paracoccaceae bacterium]|nr:MltA domain-containing protein [Paracoccaceae bacterium]